MQQVTISADWTDGGAPVAAAAAAATTEASWSESSRRCDDVDDSARLHRLPHAA